MVTMVREISAAVGTRNGITPMPNLPADLATVTELFDRIPMNAGGTREIGGLWNVDRNLLIAEVTGQIITFQTVNRLPVIDGVIDKDGGTLRLMNQLASGLGPAPGAGVTATVVAAPDGRSELINTTVTVVDLTSMPGTGPLGASSAGAFGTRRLVQVSGSSIKWFGVVISGSGVGEIFGSVPHINFTPTPIQGGYSDATYDSFGGWGQLWDDYTSVIGGQMLAAIVDQVLVIPFYRTAQQRDLGSFLGNWKEVVSAVVTAAMDSVDVMFLRDTYTFQRIVSSSFSNGYVAHQTFNGGAAGAAGMTDLIFDLDGVAGGSAWRPPNGVIYLNQTPPRSGNPVAGMHWYVGGRWGSQFTRLYPGGMSTHANCRNHLLYHGLATFCQ